MKSILIIFALLSVWLSCHQSDSPSINFNSSTMNNIDTSSLQVATFGAGCFWCVETIYQRIEGVQKVVSGYSGGKVKNPSYKEVCNGTTEHAEVCQIVFDPQKVSFDLLLKVFWEIHDPTTLNRQGADVGTQYRSVIFYHDENQKLTAEKYKEKLDSAHIWNSPVVTEITAFDVFYPAEGYHQNYYNSNLDQPYCHFVIMPKLEKFEKVFSDILKK